MSCRVSVATTQRCATLNCPRGSRELAMLLPVLWLLSAAATARSSGHGVGGGAGGVAVLSNTALPKDQHGLPLITGEASVLFTHGFWYFYFNNWGGCACAWTCTRHDPPACNATCALNKTDPLHTLEVYRTRDLVQWEHLGVAFRQPDGAAGGDLERPHVVFCKRTGTFVLWWERSFAVGGTAGPFSIACKQLIRTPPIKNTTSTCSSMTTGPRIMSV